MKKYILLSLVLIIIFSTFSSCGYKTVDIIDDETSSSPSEDTTIASEETTEETDENIDTESSEESIETTSYTETIGTAETMESIETDNGVTEKPIDTEEDIDYPSKHTYTMQKVGDQWYMVFDTYLRDPMYNHLTYVPFEVTSMDAVKQAIFYNELIDWQTEHIVYLFEPDEIGIPLPDMLDPILPSNLIVYQAFWEHEGFVVSFMDKNYSSSSDMDGAMFVIDESEFAEQYNSAPEENIYVSEDGTKTIVLKQVKNQYVDKHLLYIKIGDNYAYFSINGMPDNPDRDLIMSFGFEVLT